MDYQSVTMVYEEEGGMIKEPNSLEMLIRHETAIKQLYEVFADIFPEHRAFWQGMAEEEQKHSDCLQDLSSNESLKKWFVDDGPFQQLALSTALQHIELLIERVRKANIGVLEALSFASDMERQMERIRKANISLLEALSVASDIEEAMIEKQFIRLNIAGPTEIKSVMNRLVVDTQRHRKMLAEKLALHKRTRQ
jgi:rubrerythrin